MEEVILAMVQLESTRSMRGYIDEVMVMLKASFHSVVPRPIPTPRNGWARVGGGVRPIGK